MPDSLNNASDRLAHCFAAVFPSLPASEIRHADTGALPAWDSVNMVTLITVVEEEFGVTFDFEELELLSSFSGILGVIERKLPASQ
jgi:acyl carrier protein